MPERTRDYKFDTLKGLLIFLVVLAHSLGRLLMKQQIITPYILSAVYAFHMPAFVFVSGYFSKDACQAEHFMYKTVRTVLLPFCIAQLIMSLFSSSSLGLLFYPRWTLWYLLSLFFWRVFVLPFSKIRFSLVLSIVLALLIGFSNADRFFSLSRTIAFFPFFLMGYKTTGSQIESLRKYPKWIAGLVFLCCMAFVFFMKSNGLPLLTVFEMAEPYYLSGDSMQFQGMFFRLLFFILGTLMTSCLIILVPEKKTFLSALGPYTMTVYLAHSFLLLALQMICERFFPEVFADEYMGICLCFILTAAICWAFGNRRIYGTYQKMLNRLSSIVLVNKPEEDH